MKKGLLASVLVVVLIACGGGGGGAVLFFFQGFWLASLSQVEDTCGVIEGNEDGSLGLDIRQTANVISAETELFPLTFNGFADGNSFSIANSENIELDDILCPDGSSPTEITTTIDFNDASGDLANQVDVVFFFTCPNFSDQCRVRFTGSALRLSGAGGGSGDLPGSNLDGFVNEDPLF